MTAPEKNALIRKVYGVMSWKHYNEHKDEIPDYNCWDWMVTISMIKSDNCGVLSEWFPDDDDDMRNERIVRLALNWLLDEDNPFGSSKIWCYFNSSK